MAEKFKVKSGTCCTYFSGACKNIEKNLGLENVKIDEKTGELSYDNPKNCRVDVRKLEEAARNPGQDIEFQICD